LYVKFIKNKPEPIDCKVSDFSYNECVCTQGGIGRRNGSRVILVNPENGGKDCPPLNTSESCICSDTGRTPKPTQENGNVTNPTFQQLRSQYKYTPGTWAYGTDLAHLTGKTYSDCARQCNQTQDCAQFISTKGIRDEENDKGECYLKGPSTVNDRKSDSNWDLNYKVSAIPTFSPEFQQLRSQYEYTPGTWAYGTDLAHLTGKTYSDCARQCNQTQGCSQFISTKGIRDEENAKGECYLKGPSTVNDRKSDSNWDLNYKI
jgi:hypothetical protein